ncbi:AraC-like DNA-binding protein [Paenibacillus castaneae]|uniref:AraC family transcriptional regulator n=1 Tax=Paenibacillus castaneae TaxID=474957 RepID=UPI000C9A439E|nr:AraC family transcriptional regulator [Paenibacillus castaneae]NIK76722.1 AraC-like DNA-binding protein [Paenibacillus castaneae]
MRELYDLVYNYHGKQYCPPGYCWGPGVKDHYKILFIHEGKGTYQINGCTYTLKQGQGFLVFPDTICCMKADEQDPWVYSWIAFEGSCVERILTQLGLSKINPSFGFAPVTWFDSWLDQFSEASSQLYTSELILHSLLYRLIAEWVSLLTLPSEDHYLPKAKDLYVRKAIDYIHMNYYSKISISELAKLIGIDRIYLSSLFKEVVQLSPQMYLLHYRMNKACDLMNNPQLSISDISHSVGYNDPLLFSKMFKKIKGISPTHYRRERQIVG